MIYSRLNACCLLCVCGIVWCQDFAWECPGCGVEPAGDVA